MKRALLATAAAAAVIIGVTHLYQVEAENDATRVRPLVVTGLGEASATPDLATISLGAISEGATAAEALAKNNEAMNALFAMLGEAGIARDDIQTSSFSVNPQYVSVNPDGSGPWRVSGYQVQNQVSVKVRDLANLGTVLDKAVSAGSNSINGISFSIDDDDAVMSKARVAAIADARKQAEELATAAGVRLGEVLSITTGGSVVPPPVYYDTAVFKAESAVPTAPGLSAASVSVTVTFAME